MTHHTPIPIVVTRVSAALALGASLTGCSSPRAAAAIDDAGAPIPVTVAPVKMTDLAAVIEAGGVVQARTTATITSRVMAPVRDIRVAPGDHVRAGETLVVLGGDELASGARAARSAAIAAEQGAQAAAAELDAAEAGLVLARASHERIAGLHVRRSATAQELDDATAALRSASARVSGASARVRQAQAAFESAQATSDQARTTQSFATVVAPFDGLITEKFVDLGNMASPGIPLLQLEDTGGFRLEVRIDESRIADIRRGDRVPVLLGSDGSSTAGTVTEVSRAIDADAHAFLVKIALPDAPGLRSGTFGRARVRGRSRRALTIPSSAIVRRGQLTSVFVVEQNIARLRLVDVRDTEVLAGLVESEVVIVTSPGGLTDGRRVSPGGV
jgi:multidrug efflux pump subunit AcrA (membrane-fusion protein)